MLAFLKRSRAAGQRSQSNLGSLQVNENPNWSADLSLERAYGAVKFAKRCVRGVAHIDAKDIGSRVEQSANARLRRCSGAEGGEYFCLAAPSHRPSVGLGSSCAGSATGCRAWQSDCQRACRSSAVTG